jgi:hypothetical protein
MIRRACAVFAAAVILGRVLMPVMVAKAWATEPGHRGYVRMVTP